MFFKFRYYVSKIGSLVSLFALPTFNVFGLVANVSTGAEPSKVVLDVFFAPLK